MIMLTIASGSENPSHSSKSADSVTYEEALRWSEGEHNDVLDRMLATDPRIIGHFKKAKLTEAQKKELDQFVTVVQPNWKGAQEYLYALSQLSTDDYLAKRNKNAV